HIAAVDVSAESLAVAARGRYGRNSFREDMAEAARHFTRRDDDEHSAVWTVRPEVAAAVTFVQANIVGEGFLVHEKPFDIIFSRNLLIYLNHDARKRLLANIRRLLVPDGLLFVGHSEMLSFLPEGFQPVSHSRAFACTRADPGPAAPVAASPTRTAIRLRGGKTPPAADRAAAPRTLPRSLADVFAPRSASRTTAGRGGEDDLGLAWRLADRGELAEAAALCRRHLETHRRSAEAYYLLGLVGAAERRVEEARAFFQKALYLEPDHAASLTHLALIHEQLGDAARAALYRQRLRRLSETGGTRP
ncbi:MAG: methyltransferase domain-containing protein, partial [Desulfovibrio sp.]|nr:methyltransferase domain-containing protein [Desulfovibrio sp.]